MNLKRTIKPLALALTIAVGATPALAQSGNRDGQRRSQSRAARPNGGGDRTQSRAAQAPENRDRGSRAGEGERRVAVPRAAPGENDWRRAEIQRNDRGAGDRGYDSRGQDSRVYDSRRDNGRRYDSRRYDDRRYDSRRYDGRVYSNRGYASGYYGRPYAIRPGARFGLGISIFAGNPFAFHFRYGRTPGYAYRYPIRTGIAYGGMSFLVDPDDTEVIIDGVFVGIAREFGGQPVPVAVGYHRVELYAPGCEPVVFDVTVMPGQVIPYRGSLMPASGY
jgi:hypothetical protein